VDVFEEGLDKMDTTDLEANWEKSEAVLEQQDIPMEGTEVENIRALVYQYGDWHLAPGHHQQPKKQTQGNGGSQQKLTTAQGQLTCHAIPALRKVTVVRDRAGTMLYEEPLKGEQLGRDIRCNKNATTI
jgi:hypothetical protein